MILAAEQVADGVEEAAEEQHPRQEQDQDGLYEGGTVEEDPSSDCGEDTGEEEPEQVAGLDRVYAADEGERSEDQSRAPDCVGPDGEETEQAGRDVPRDSNADRARDGVGRGGSPAGSIAVRLDPVEPGTETMAAMAWPAS
ncbi:hypothetical protein OG984_09640 [Nocardioides sp. NBC_00368]